VWGPLYVWNQCLCVCRGPVGSADRVIKLMCCTCAGGACRPYKEPLALLPYRQGALWLWGPFALVLCLWVACIFGLDVSFEAAALLIIYITCYIPTLLLINGLPCPFCWLSAGVTIYIHIYIYIYISIYIIYYFIAPSSLRHIHPIDVNWFRWLYLSNTSELN
jgi:hypothetical protein